MFFGATTAFIAELIHVAMFVIACCYWMPLYQRRNNTRNYNGRDLMIKCNAGGRKANNICIWWMQITQGTDKNADGGFFIYILFFSGYEWAKYGLFKSLSSFDWISTKKSKQAVSFSYSMSFPKNRRNDFLQKIFMVFPPFNLCKGRSGVLFAKILL